MYKKGILSFLFVCFLVLPFVGSHVCNDVLPGGSQYKEGCEPIIITVPGGASQDGNEVSLVINVENRQTPYSPATSCGNPWSSTLSNVRIASVTPTPSCSNCFSMNNPGTYNIPINTNKDYNTIVTINSGATPGTYKLKFEIKPGSFASRYVEVSGVVVDESCTPTTCQSLGFNCGSHSDGCGGTLNCGSCSSGQSCSDGVCVSSSCTLPWGGSINHGQTVTAYQSSSVPCGSTCSSQTRTCSNGALSGTYTNQNCEVEECPSSCSLPWGGSINHGQTVTAYQSSSVPCGSTCTSQTRTCSNGALSGTYTNQNCEVEACPSSCSLPWGGSINHGQTVTAYQSSSVPCGSTCSSQTRTCSNGALSGTYTYQSCSVQQCSSCTLPWGGTINHGQSTTAYQSSSVPCGSTCSSQTRTCSNGALSGTYTNQNCEVEECPSSCSLPWGGSINHGQSVTAFQSSSVPCGSTCTSQTRTCSNTVLSGTYTNQNCNMEECCVPETNSVFCNRNNAVCGSFSGSDNCGVSRTVTCGSCASGEDCVAGVCVEPCVSDCSGKDCGDDGCGGSCGSCSSDLFCSNNMCVEECTPDCSSKECGDDGCGGSCGSCQSGEICSNNECVCTPITCKSLGVFCGSHDDGCGATLNCGSCSSNKTCVAGFCVEECTPDCSGKECGGDGCGGSCGSCSSDCSCASGVCDCSALQDVNGEEIIQGNDSFQVGVVDEIPDVDSDSEAKNLSSGGFGKFIQSSSFSYLFVFLFVVVFFSLYILYRHKTSSSSAVSSSSSSSVGISSSDSGASSTDNIFQESGFALLEREGITQELFENCKASILKMRSNGFSDDDIINKFVSSGWPREKILLVFKFLN